jgi:hypothetical protein
MKNIFHKILNHPEVKDNPPVLVDIGASEKIHPKWKAISKYSFCVAFDADDRDFKFVEKKQTNFKKLYVFNSVVVDGSENTIDFYLTKSPYCSGVLKPDRKVLQPNLHSDLFDVEKVVKLNATNLHKALSEIGFSQIDWFKCDSQGTDLRLFKSLDENIRSKLIVAEFEPGIIDAYESEDKLYSLLEYLTEERFWLSDINIKGVPRIPLEVFNSEFKNSIFKKLLKESIKPAPGWGEMTFINSFEATDFGMREYLLGWLFCTMENHHPFALVLALKGIEKFQNEIFKELKIYSKKMMMSQVYKGKFLPSIFGLIKKKLL